MDAFNPLQNPCIIGVAGWLNRGRHYSTYLHRDWFSVLTQTSICSWELLEWTRNNTESKRNGSMVMGCIPQECSMPCKKDTPLLALFSLPMFYCVDLSGPLNCLWLPITHQKAGLGSYASRKLLLAFLLARLILHQFSEFSLQGFSPPQGIKKRNRASAKEATGGGVKRLGPWRNEPSLSVTGSCCWMQPGSKNFMLKASMVKKGLAEKWNFVKKTHNDINKQKLYCFRPYFFFSCESHWL